MQQLHAQPERVETGVMSGEDVPPGRPVSIRSASLNVPRGLKRRQLQGHDDSEAWWDEAVIVLMPFLVF